MYSLFPASAHLQQTKASLGTNFRNLQLVLKTRREDGKHTAAVAGCSVQCIPEQPIVCVLVAACTLELQSNEQSWKATACTTVHVYL